MAHRQIQTNFRLNAWKGVRGTSTSVFNANAVSQELSPVLEYIIQELYEAGYPSVKSGAFSLVNIYNPDTKHSVGYSERPHQDLVKPMTGLTLTFSMVSRPLIKTPAEIFDSRITDFTIFWGTSFTNSNDYLVVSVPKEILKNTKVAWGLVDDLFSLYNIIGAVTKNYVQNEYNPRNTVKFNVPNMPLGMLKSKYLELTLPNLLKNVHPMYWPFNLDLWTKASQLLMPRHLVDSLNLYMCVHVLDMLGPRLSPQANSYINGTGPNTLNYFIQDGVRGILQVLRSKNVPDRAEDSIYGTLHLLFSMVEAGGIGETEDYATVSSILQGMLDRFESNPELEQDFLQKFTSIQLVSKQILNGDDDLRRFLEEVF